MVLQTRDQVATASAFCLSDPLLVQVCSLVLLHRHLGLQIDVLRRAVQLDTVQTDIVQEARYTKGHFESRYIIVMLYS